MPYTFDFQAPDADFSCGIETKRCRGIAKSGNRCKRLVAIGTPLCFQHRKDIKVKPSSIPDAGKGLFAHNKSKPANEVIFKRGTVITQYGGEKNLTKEDIDDRYGNNTAPYGVKYANNRYEDAACERGVGSLANKGTGGQINAKLYPNGRGSIFLKATKNIRNNREILLSYGRQYRLNEPDVEYSTTLGRR